ncbi:MAG: hypothetical protein H6832_08995 [Planctomycetes bacterium]|nr:hypothetical protein [Planctomycetota bacterium]MCB9918527.1 hypothetical protein [Planctomycetota bacterium]
MTLRRRGTPARSRMHAIVVAMVAGVFFGGCVRAPRAQSGATERTIEEFVRSFAGGVPEDRKSAEAALRALGAPAVEPMLRLLEQRLESSSGDRGAPRVDPRIVDFALELAPASAGERLVALLGERDEATRGRLVSWLARRDVEGVRDFETPRAMALLDFVRREDGDQALVAARALAKYDIDVAAKGLAAEIGRLVDAGGHRDLLLACARSFAELRAAGPYVDALFSDCERDAPWLAPALLPAFRRLADRVLEGRIDRLSRSRAPAVHAAFEQLVVDLDRDLFAAQEHARRVTLFERFRDFDPGNLEWAVRAAHAAVMDAGDDRKCALALAELEHRASDHASDVAIESSLLNAVASYLRGENPMSFVREALQRSDSSWSDDASSGESGTFFGAAEVEFQYQNSWRSQLEPALGEDEVVLRHRRFVREGGIAGRAFRAHGRRRVSVLLVGAIFYVLEGNDPEAARWFREARDVVQSLESDWDFAAAGEPGDLEAALTMRCGPYDVLERALEGNESMKVHMDANALEAHRRAARRGYRALVEGLWSVMPERVLPLPGMAPGPSLEGARERAYLDVTGAYARFLHRLGDEAEASTILASLIEDLDHAGLWSNRRAWAGYLFDHAGIEIDRRNAASAKASLQKFLEHYEESLRDVRQSPERYVDARAAESFFASRLATGHISMAVLHNVVLGQLDVAREHCRKAYALEDNPFNRVLYSCYLARDKKYEEAAALLETVDASPPLYYNMACTYALSGKKSEALEYLALDLTWNHATEKARNRQREWAAKDHDLESLRGDARFEELIRPR